MSNCLPGLQGFPIQVTGWQSIADKTPFIMPSDISLQFSPSIMPMAYQAGSFSINGTNTFFMGGNQYFVRMARLCAPKQDGLAKNVGSKPIAELHLWGLPTTTTKADNTIGLLCIPIFQGPVTSTAGKVFLKLLGGQSIRLQNLIPVGNDIEVVRYTTCIETNTDTTMSILVAYWSNGIILTQQDLRLLPTTLQPYGIPQFSTYSFVSSYELTEGGKGKRTYDVKNGITIPYTSLLGATSSDFIKGFRYILGFNQQSIQDNTDTSAYKCIAIDRSRDIKNGKLQVDPATGKRLTDEVKDADPSESADTPKYSPRDIMETIFTIIGVILGILLIGVIMYGINYMLITRKSLGEPPISSETVAAAAALGPQAGN